MKCKVVNPTPYFKISTGSSNRGFYSIKNLMSDIVRDFDPDQEKDIWDENFVEKCDYEGDLELIIIHNCELTTPIIAALFKEWGIKKNHNGMDIHVGL